MTLRFVAGRALLLQDLGLPWPSLFTGKLSNQTKLVGPVITCQDIIWPETIPESQRSHGQPYFPPHMLVSDQVNPDLRLVKAGSEVACLSAARHRTLNTRNEQLLPDLAPKGDRCENLVTPGHCRLGCNSSLKTKGCSPVTTARMCPILSATQSSVQLKSSSTMASIWTACCSVTRVRPACSSRRGCSFSHSWNSTARPSSLIQDL